MTEEELDKEAEKWAIGLTYPKFQDSQIANIVLRDVEGGFQKGAEFGYNKAKEEMQKNGLALQSDMDKTIEQNMVLKAQIEKMKCCQNCKFEDNDCIEEPCSACTRCLGDIKRKGNSDKWEIK